MILHKHQSESEVAALFLLRDRYSDYRRFGKWRELVEFLINGDGKSVVRLFLYNAKRQRWLFGRMSSELWTSCQIRPEDLPGLKYAWLPGPYYRPQVCEESHRASEHVLPLQPGEVCTIRFLPVKFGDFGDWRAHLARHSLPRESIICPRHTWPANGGNSYAECPCCDLAADLMRYPESLGEFGYNSSAKPHLLTLAIAYSRNKIIYRRDELVRPYAVWIPYESHCELDLNTQNADYRTGCNFEVSRPDNLLKLEALPCSPIWPHDDIKQFIQEVEATMRAPIIQMPSLRELNNFSSKIQAEAERLAQEISVA